ncbi:MAG: glycosyltransferase [Cyanobacteria bacterium P01_G01_bin.38]
MRIAYIVGQFPVASKTFIVNQIVGLIERGHTVDIYAEEPKEKSVIHGDVEKYHLTLCTKYPPQVPSNWTLRLGKGVILAANNFHKNPSALWDSLNIFKHGRKAGSLRFFYEVIPFLDHHKYDIVHCHFGPNGIQSLPIRQLGLLQGKLVTTFHALGLTKYIQSEGSQIYESLFREGDLFLPISHYWKDYLIKLGCEEHKLKVHRMGINCDRFKFVPRRLQAKAPVRLVSVCRLVEKKGIEYAIRAVAEVANTQAAVEYRIIGDGPLKESLESLIKELGVSHYIKILGWQEQNQIIQQLEQSHILLAPSVTAKDGDQEGIPVAIMEAMATGMPVVSTFHSGIPELIEDGVTGFLVPERSIDKLSDRIKALINNPQMWEVMGAKGREHIQTKYDTEMLNSELVNTFGGLIASQEISHV